MENRWKPERLLRYEPLGDCGVTVRLGEAIDEAVHRRVLAFAGKLRARPFPGLTEVVPGYHTVTVFYDPVAVRRHMPQRKAADSGEKDGSAARLYETVCAWMDELWAQAKEGAKVSRRCVEIPVLYGGEWGPDLDEVSRRCGLAPEETVALHSGAEYTVYMIGFAPGFPYLGGLPERLAMPRRETPRLRVAAGSVGIGGSQTGVYPLETPGGWQIIGRTPLSLFRPDREEPALLRSGDRVRFVPIDARRYMELANL